MSSIRRRITPMPMVMGRSEISLPLSCTEPLTHRSMVMIVMIPQLSLYTSIDLDGDGLCERLHFVWKTRMETVGTVEPWKSR